MLRKLDTGCTLLRLFYQNDSLSVTVFITQDVICIIILSVLVSPIAGTPKFVYTVGQKVGS